MRHHQHCWWQRHLFWHHVQCSQAGLTRDSRIASDDATPPAKTIKKAAGKLFHQCKAKPSMVSTQTLNGVATLQGAEHHCQTSCQCVSVLHQSAAGPAGREAAWILGRSGRCQPREQAVSPVTKHSLTILITSSARECSSCMWLPLAAAGFTRDSARRPQALLASGRAACALPSALAATSTSAPSGLLGEGYASDPETWRRSPRQSRMAASQSKWRKCTSMPSAPVCRQHGLQLSAFNLLQR